MSVQPTGETTTVSWTGYETKRLTQDAKQPHEVKLGLLFKSTKGVGTLTCGDHKALVFDPNQMGLLDKLKFNIGTVCGFTQVKKISLGDQEFYVSTTSLAEAGGIESFRGVNAEKKEKIQDAKVTAIASQLKEAITQQNGQWTKIPALVKVKKDDEKVTLTSAEIHKAFAVSARDAEIWTLEGNNETDRALFLKNNCNPQFFEESKTDPTLAKVLLGKIIGIEFDEKKSEHLRKLNETDKVMNQAAPDDWDESEKAMYKEAQDVWNSLIKNSRSEKR